MKKVLVGILIIIMVMAVLVHPTKAANDFTIKMSVDKTTISAGDTIVVTFKLADVDITEGVSVIEGKLEYDSNVFDKVLQADITSKTGWGAVTYNETEGKFVVERAAGDAIKVDNDIMSVTLRVKGAAVAGNTSIKLAAVVGTVGIGSGDVTIPDITYPLTISVSAANNNTTTNNTTTNNITANNNTTTNNTANSNTAGSIPKAGIEDYITPAIMLIAVVGIISFIRYRKIGNI